MTIDYKKKKIDVHLLRISGRNLKNKLWYLASELERENAGFSLLEVLAIVAIIGILSAIVAPGWLGFIQQQRVNKTQSAVLSAIQEAQGLAQKTKRNYNVSFATNNSVLQTAIYPATSTPDSYWRNLVTDFQIPAGTLILGANFVGTNSNCKINNNSIITSCPEINNNTVQTSSYSSSYTTSSSGQNITISFDYMGALPTKANLGTPPQGSNDPPGLKVVVAIPSKAGLTTPSGMKRCVIVNTILGRTIIAKDSQCN